MPHDLTDFQKAIADIASGIRPNPLTGEVEFTDIIHYINTHVDDPKVQRYLEESEKRTQFQKEERTQVLRHFDIKALKVEPGTTWLICLEYSGLTTDPTTSDTWYPSRNKEDEVKSANTERETPQQTFQLFSYIREGPNTDGGDNSRHVEDFVGLPTSQQIEDFLKISMAKPIECFTPSIPSTIAFSYNLRAHEKSLRPFLRSLPWECRYIFESAEIHNRTRENRFAEREHQFREYITHATDVKNAGNKAYALKDRENAISKYEQAIDELERLLLLSLSEEEAKDKETRRFLSVCLANCSAARMLGESDTEGAKKNAEKAIKIDPDYPKGYIRLSRVFEALEDTSGAQASIVRALRMKSLEDHVGLANHLVLLQTSGNGLSEDKEEYIKWFEDTTRNEEGSVGMTGIGGAWKRLCDEHANKLGLHSA